MFSRLSRTFKTFAKAHYCKSLSTAMKNGVKVQVKQGCVLGRENETLAGTIFHSFQGIPYAHPPIGNLRFKSPVALERFPQNELDCTKERDVSHQRDPMTREVMGSEDCLFLNIYAPKKKTNAPLPVLVFIHGGGFWFGSGNSDYLFPQRFMDEDVVVVTFNYRLGAFGFLSLPAAEIWGNAGLKDQRLCLEWVNQNIAAFNGDPQNVTLFGESAGAAAVHLHAYAAHANKLFHKIIMQSGTANMEWVFQPNPDYKARKLVQLMGCQSKDTKEILKFLQSDQVTPNGILSKVLDVLTDDERRRGLPLAFKPIIEVPNSPDKFIDRPINELLRQPNRLKIPTIMGYNSSEGIPMLVNALRKLSQINNDLERFLPRNIPLDLENDKKEISELVKRMRRFYFNNETIDERQLDALTALLSDYHFTVDIQNAAELQVTFQTTAPLYFYQFDYVGRRNLYKQIFQMDKLRGACHGDELFYLFQMAGDTQKLHTDDEQCSKRLCRLWANFARDGKPTQVAESSESIIDFEWRSVRKPNAPTFVLDYLSINKQCEMRTNPDKERVEFWNNIYNEYAPTDYSRLSAKL